MGKTPGIFQLPGNGPCEMEIFYIQDNEEAKTCIPLFRKKLDITTMPHLGDVLNLLSIVLSFSGRIINKSKRAWFSFIK